MLRKFQAKKMKELRVAKIVRKRWIFVPSFPFFPSRSHGPRCYQLRLRSRLSCDRDGVIYRSIRPRSSDRKTVTDIWTPSPGKLGSTPIKTKMQSETREITNNSLLYRKSVLNSTPRSTLERVNLWPAFQIRGTVLERHSSRDSPWCRSVMQVRQVLTKVNANSSSYRRDGYVITYMCEIRVD